jgi:hypothetical protein
VRAARVGAEAWQNTLAQCACQLKDVLAGFHAGI